jgi:hypothetical protein
LRQSPPFQVLRLSFEASVTALSLEKLIIGAQLRHTLHRPVSETSSSTR